MTKSVFTPAYRDLLQSLVAMRDEQGLSQTELASRLGVPQQFVSRYELGIRRIDVVEFVAIVTALGGDPIEVLRRVASSISAPLEIGSLAR